MIAPRTLSQYPWVVVRVACRLCRRRGCYRLARLAARYGPEFPLDRLLAALSGDCPWWRPPERIRKYDPSCGARFVDLDRNLPPPDLPEAASPPHRTVAREDHPNPPQAPAAAAALPMLSGWGAPTIVLFCVRCGRRDSFAVAQLLQVSGDVSLIELRLGLTLNCPRVGAQSIYERCGAAFERFEGV